MDEFSDPVAIGKAMGHTDLKGAPHYGTNYAELAGCLRGAVTAMEILEGTDDARFLSPGLPNLIKRSKAALKEYDNA
jgi:hypothetical protein